MVGGQPYEIFLEEQVEDFKAQQEAERACKNKLKKETNFHETIYGSKPVQAVKRTATMKRKAAAPATPNDTKRLRPGTSMGTTFGSATLRSPAVSAASSRVKKV